MIETLEPCPSGKTLFGPDAEHVAEILRRHEDAWLPDELLGLFPKGAKIDVLDVGCGSRSYIHEFANKCGCCVGLDCDREPLVISSRLSGGTGTGPAVMMGDVHRLPFKGESFDLVLALQTLEHLDYPLTGISELTRVLRPGGILYATVPNGESVSEVSRSFVHKVTGVKNPHRTRFVRDELRKCLEHSALTILRWEDCMALAGIYINLRTGLIGRTLGLETDTWKTRERTRRGRLYRVFLQIDQYLQRRHPDIARKFCQVWVIVGRKA